MQTSQVLNDLESQYYLDQLLSLNRQSGLAPREQLIRINPIFISLLNTLTEYDAHINPVFTGWFAKVNFISQRFSLDPGREEELHSLRRLLRKLMSQEGFEVNQEQVLLAIKILAETLEQFSTLQLPGRLKEMYEEIVDKHLSYREYSSENLEDLTLSILEKGKLQVDEQRKGCISLLCESTDYGRVQVNLEDLHYYDPVKKEVFRKYSLSQQAARLTQAYQVIRITRLRKETEDVYHSTEETLLVASPDYLIDATSIANCFQVYAGSPYLHLLKRFRFFQGNFHTFMGKLLNDLLDYYIETGEKDFETAFQHMYSQSLLEAAFLDLKEGEIEQMRHKLKPQFATILRVMKQFQNPEKEDNTPSITTEPSFISPRYGLQGRIDLLLAYAQQVRRKDIIELKGTNYKDASYETARKDHLSQVACYNLLVDSVFPERTGVSAILYSRDELNPLRDCGKMNFEEQDAMWIRNCLVFLDLKLARGEEKFWQSLVQKFKQLRVPVYKQEEVRSFVENWENAGALSRSFFRQYFGFVVREMWVAKVGGLNQDSSGGFANLWNQTPREKQDNFSLLSDLQLSRIDEANSFLYFDRPPAETSVSAFREGDIIILYPHSADQHLEPDGYPLLKGNLETLSAQEIQVKVWHRAIDPGYLKQFSHWAIEPNMLESGFNHQMSSLAYFLGLPPEKKRIYLGLAQPRFDDNFHLEPYKTLSAQQNKILKKALSAQDYFLLQGPPGTGKTSRMLRYMVDYLFHHTQEVLVLLAFTNRATDEIVEKVQQVCPDSFLRLGSQSQSGAGQEAWEKLGSLSALRQKLGETRIFISTVSSFFSYQALIPAFDTLIVDEASQLLDPNLCAILPRFRRFILIGDEKQLPAVVTQSSRQCQVDDPTLQAIQLSDLRTSVFDRLLRNAQQKQWPQVWDMLKVQFRTHEQIAGFISREFYQDLQIGSEGQKEALSFYDAPSSDPWERRLSVSRMLFIASSPTSPLKYHPEEAETVVQILSAIRGIFSHKDNFDPLSVGVITPYRAQIAEIQKRMDAPMRTMVTVDTVERYQGSERRIIILSMALNHPALMENLQALDPEERLDKKLNVALSRAKEQFILLGNPQILSTGKFYKRLLAYIQKQDPLFGQGIA